MNNTRRKQLRKEVIELVEIANQALDEIKDEEQEGFDNMPEGLQEGERGEAIEEKVTEMQEIHDELADLINRLHDVVE